MDTVLTDMANEVRSELGPTAVSLTGWELRVELRVNEPAYREAWCEYKRRGGRLCTTAEVFTARFVELVYAEFTD
jgi:hypothetical protein